MQPEFHWSPRPDATQSAVEPRFIELRYNEVFDITNDNLQPDQSYSKMYGKEPRYNEILVERKQSRSPNV